MSPDGSKLVIIGNFMKVNTQPRPQVALIDLSTTPASLANWQTDRYVPPCFSNAFDTYMRDVDFSPDGSYFVIASTGGPNFGTLCDTAARWESNAQGAALQPTWVDATGGDTLSAIAVTGAAVYAGGHQRWQNNWYGSDQTRSRRRRPARHRGSRSSERPAVLMEPDQGSWEGCVRPVLDGPMGCGWGATPTGRVAGGDCTRSSPSSRSGWEDTATERSLHAPRRPVQRPDLVVRSSRPLDPVPRARRRPEVAAVDCGPRWVADDSDGAAGAAYRNTGSNNVSSWNQQFTVGNTVPSTTPSAIFNSERWDPASLPRCSGTSPCPQERTSRSACTSSTSAGAPPAVGQRVFNVAIDGNTVLNHYDIVADVGDRVGTMKSFNIPNSDGNVNIDFSHVTENPLINGIEIVNADVPPGPGPGAISYLPRRTLRWDDAGRSLEPRYTGNRLELHPGIFALQGMLYNGSSNGNFYARTFDGTKVGPPQPINLNGLSDFPVQSLSGLFYADGRMYYTVTGDPQMHYRLLHPGESDRGVRSLVGGCLDASGRLEHRPRDDACERQAVLRAHRRQPLLDGLRERGAGRWHRGAREPQVRRLRLGVQRSVRVHPHHCRHRSAHDSRQAGGSEPRHRDDRDQLGGVHRRVATDHLPHLPRRQPVGQHDVHDLHRHRARAHRRLLRTPTRSMPSMASATHRAR